MKVDRTRYFGGSVILCSSTKCAPYREKAARLILENFLAHEDVFKQVDGFRKRRNQVYKVVMDKLYAANAIEEMVGKNPVDYRTCFTIGGSADQPLDNEALADLFDCILSVLDMHQLDVFTAETAERFRTEAVVAIRANKLQLGLALHELGKEERRFELTGDEGGDRMYTKIRSVVPKANLLKDEIRSMAYSVSHAASNGIDGVYVTGEQCFGEHATLNKVSNVVSQILKMKPDECPQIAHISETFY